MVKIGDRVDQGQPVFVVHARDESSLRLVEKSLAAAIKIKDEKCAPLHLYFQGFFVI